MSSQSDPIRVSTGEFWNCMCKPGFYRSSSNTGVIGNTVYYTSNPPEKAPGFLDTVLDEINEALSPKPIKWPWFNWSVNRAIRRAMRGSR